jgi:hypothetical protein
LARTAGRTSVSMKRAYRSDIVSYSRPRSLPRLSPPPFATAIATNAGKRRSAGVLSWVKLSRAFRMLPSCPGPSWITMNGAGVPSLYFAGT